LDVEKRLDAGHVSPTPHGADFRHAVAFVQRGQTVKLTAAVTTKNSFADRFIGSE
jgi:hypothetical protein